jgi:N-acyl-D-aspartate/D-glutamate deacylase
VITVLDIVIKNGTVVDGTGAPARRADVAVKDGRIVRIADSIDEPALESIDAAGRIVTPGFVDIHTHYDGQVTWDGELNPSAAHGVTTVITGNCGVGFAPVRPGREDHLVRLMEGVEDIPGTALYEGMTWGWESFPEYMDNLRGRSWSMDVGVQLPHGPLRTYVMGDERAGGNAEASPEDVAEMARLAREAMEAGAFGFTTSRTLGHLSSDGVPVPGTFADDDELFAIAKAVRDGGGRIFEVAMAGIVPHDDGAVTKRELDWIGTMARETGLTATFIVLQHDQDPLRWRQEMDAAAQWRRQGARVVPLVAGRPFGVLLGLEVRNPFALRPSYEAVADLPVRERIAAMRDPGVRARILAEDPVAEDDGKLLSQRGLAMVVERCYVLESGAEPDYEQDPSRSIGALARSRGVSALEVAYDALTSSDEPVMLLLPLFNYADGNHDVLHEQMMDDAAVVGLADGGAHCGAICDASIPTYMLTHWVKGRTRGARLTLEDGVRRLTSQPADVYGLSDRGRLEEGKRADINVIDLENLRLLAPHAVHDLPAGGLRLLQDAEGYDATIVAGRVTRRNGADTGERPGRLVTTRG